MSPIVSPHGSWKSPITASLLTAGKISLSQLRYEAGRVYWIEGRPLEKGRSVLVECVEGGEPRDLVPAGMSVASRVHEYGGGSFASSRGTVYCCNDEDQRIHRIRARGRAKPITPKPAVARGLRYADLQMTSDGKSMVCVRERHVGGQEPFNELVLVKDRFLAKPKLLTSGCDFYASPCLSPDGKLLAWLQWNHPNMPWDGCELMLADFSTRSGLSNARRIAGGEDESVFQPRFSPDGELHFVSDPEGWWNLHALREDGVVSLCPMEAEFGAPQWVFGQSMYCFLSGGRIACVFIEGGVEKLGILHRGDARPRMLDIPYTTFGQGGELQSDGEDRLFFCAAAPTRALRVVDYRVSSGESRVLRRSMETDPEADYLSTPEPMEFPTGDGETAFALYYPPFNRDFAPPDHEKPPLIVTCHGGPTGATSTELNLKAQYWTSRGFAVVDVNYRGSSGYGRRYRELINGASGIVEPIDCIRAAEHLRDRGQIDAARIAIRGGSAGGYVVLCAVVFHDLFAAGASYYGIADVEALVRDTHKFEARYPERLIAPYPEAREIFRERSPLHFVDRVSCPVILFQGLDDKVVPPAQAEAMVEALKAKGLPHAYMPFAGEGHGFRRAANIRRAQEAELYFYSRVFGFEAADEIEAVEISSL